MKNNIENLNLMDCEVITDTFGDFEQITLICPHCNTCLPEDLILKESLGHSLINGTDYEIYKIKCINIDCKKEFLYYV